MTNAVRKIIGSTTTVFSFCTCCRRAACPTQALASLAHTSVPARPGRVRSDDHMLYTRPQAGAWPQRRFRGSWVGRGRVSLHERDNRLLFVFFFCAAGTGELSKSLQDSPSVLRYSFASLSKFPYCGSLCAVLLLSVARSSRIVS
jgi:hypothetical protein